MKGDIAVDWKKDLNKALTKVNWWFFFGGIASLGLLGFTITPFVGEIFAIVIVFILAILVQKNLFKK